MRWHVSRTTSHEQQLDKVFMALADASRRRLVQRLAQGECRVGDLAAPFDISLAAVSKHIKVLEGAGLVRRRVAGREHYCALVPEHLGGALDWITIYR